MCKDDEKWVTEQIKLLPDYNMRMKGFNGYNALYKKSFDNESIEHKKTGTARKAANTALRVFVKKVTESIKIRNKNHEHLV